MNFWHKINPFAKFAKNEEYDVVGIGHAIVDVMCFVNDQKIEDLRLQKGVMTLVSEHHSQEIYEHIGPTMEMSGGSAANTMVGVASLGGKSAYLGKIRHDSFGKIFTHDIRAAGVHFITYPAEKGHATARSIILVTPDAHRTMATYLGISAEFNRKDLDPQLIAQGKVTYLEGYLYDSAESKQAFITAAQIARAAGRKVALTLSDPFCVTRHLAEFQNLVHHHIDILFANEAEAMALTAAASFDEAVKALRGVCELTALTRSEKGSVVMDAAQLIEIPAKKIEKLVDSTGAGDLYAAGFLTNWARGKSLAEMGQLGSADRKSVV